MTTPTKYNTLTVIWTVAFLVFACGGNGPDGGGGGEDGGMKRIKYGGIISWPAREGNVLGAATMQLIPRSLVRASTTESRNPGEPNPTQWACQLDIDYFAAVSGAFHIPINSRVQVTAIVTWGVFGSTNSAEIDVTAGTSFNVVGDYVQIDIVDESVYFGSVPVGSPFTVTGTVTENGSIPSKATRTYIADDIYAPPAPASLSGGAIGVVVPSFAKTLDVRRYATGVASDYTIRIGDPGYIEVATLNIVAGAEFPSQYVLPGTAGVVRWTNIGANIQRLSFVFGLDL